MSDKDRGTYSPPTEDNLSFEPRRGPGREEAPVTLIISAICLVVLLVVVVILYNSGLNKHNKIAPEVGDSVSDFKEGPQVQDAQPLNESDAAGDGGQVILAPGTEAPNARASAAPAPDEAPPTVAPITGPLPSQANNPALNSNQSVDTTPVPGAPAASSAASKPIAAAKPVVTAPALAVAPKPITVPKADTAPKPVAASGGSAVQIGAFTSTDIANKEYAKIASSYGLFVGGAGKKVEPVTTANGTFYRTAFTGLSSEKAHAFCSALKAAGHDCIIR